MTQDFDGVVAKLERGAKVADVGCGLGASSIRLAQAFPRVRVFGYDARPEAIELARRHAAEAGVAQRVTFDVASSFELPGREYDLVRHFGGLPDLDDPCRAARLVKDALASGGTWLIAEVDPRAGESRLHRVLTDAGFTRFRRATEAMFDLVLEAQL